jgi:hypothetical protein
MVLHVASPLLALALVLLTTEPARARFPRLQPPVRAIALVGLAGASAAFLLLRGAPSPATPALEPFALAALSILVGWLILYRSGQVSSVRPPLAEAADAIVVGAAAATLALLSRAPAAGLGLLCGPFGETTIYMLCALSGLFACYSLSSATFLPLTLAALAWLAIAKRLGGPDGGLLPAIPMLLLFLGCAWIGSTRRRTRGGQA